MLFCITHLFALRIHRNPKSRPGSYIELVERHKMRGILELCRPGSRLKFPNKNITEKLTALDKIYHYGPLDKACPQDELITYVTSIYVIRTSWRLGFPTGQSSEVDWPNISVVLQFILTIPSNIWNTLFSERRIGNLNFTRAYLFYEHLQMQIMHG